MNYSLRRFLYGFLFSCVGILGLSLPCLAADAPETPSFLDSAAQGQQAARTLTISKEFAATGTHRYLFYAFKVSGDSSVDSVTWHGQTMAPLVISSSTTDGQGTYVYGLSNPDVGAEYDAVVTMSEGEVVYDGILLLYAGASSTQPDAIGDMGVGSAGGVTSTVAISTPGSTIVSLVRNGDDDDIGPVGDAIRRASEHGVTTGSFGAFERGPFTQLGNHSISVLFDEETAYSLASFSIAPAVAPEEEIPESPVFIDSVAQGQQAERTLTISKEFATTGTHRYLFYAFTVSGDSSVDSVTWHGQTMAPLIISSSTIDGQGVYVYGLANPDVGGEYDGVVTMSEGEVVYDGLLLLYGGASSTQPSAIGDIGFGSAGGVTTTVAIAIPGSTLVSVIRNGDDSDIQPVGDAIRRASEHGVTTGSFGAFERGPFTRLGEHSVGTVFDEGTAYSFASFSIAPAVASLEDTRTAGLLDSSSGVGDDSTLTISKNFTDVGTDRVLFLDVQTDSGHSIDSVTWRGTPMTLLSETPYLGVVSRVYVLNNPDVGDTYDAVVSASEGGTVFSGAIQLYQNMFSD